MATASAATSTSSATRSTRPSASCRARDTRIDLGYEYLHDRRTADRGVPSARPTAIEPLEGFDRTFFGDPDKSFAKADVHIATLGVEHRFGDGLTLRNRTLYGDYDKFYQNIYPNGAGRPAPGMVRLVGLQRHATAAESVHPDRPDLGKPPRRHRPDAAGRLRARPAEGHNQRRNGVFDDGRRPTSIDVPLGRPDRRRRR